MLRFLRSRRTHAFAIVIGVAAVILLSVLVVHARFARGPSSRVFLSRLAYVPGARCIIGSREGRSDEYPRVVVLDDFWVGRWEVTVREYADYLNAVGASTAPTQDFVLRGTRWMPRFGRGKYPVSGVGVEDAEGYCRWMSGIYGVAVRLPTEDEWEYAARGCIDGARYPWGWGDPIGRASFDRSAPKRVGCYRPNPYGLYDMAGNVFEWCSTVGGDFEVARGGSWAERSAECLRVFHRARFAPDYADADVGFRIVVAGDRSLSVKEG